MYDPYSPYGGYYAYPGLGQLPQNQINPQIGQPQTQVSQGIIKVHGREGALTLGNSLGPNKAVLAIDETKENIMWCIATDGAGFATVKPFKYAPDEDDSDAQNESPITRKEFDELVSKVDEISTFVKELKE